MITKPGLSRSNGLFLYLFGVGTAVDDRVVVVHDVDQPHLGLRREILSPADLGVDISFVAVVLACVVRLVVQTSVLGCNEIASIRIHWIIGETNNAEYAAGLLTGGNLPNQGDNLIREEA